jgi:hypothetical protein
VHQLILLTTTEKQKKSNQHFRQTNKQGNKNMESIQGNDLELNSENTLTELSEDELDQIHGGLFWLAVLAGVGIARRSQAAKSQESSPSQSPTIPTVGGFIHSHRNSFTIGY